MQTKTNRTPTKGVISGVYFIGAYLKKSIIKGEIQIFCGIYIKYEHYLSLQAKSVPWLPNVVIGVVTVVVGLACLLLPETKDWPLPMSIADVYRYSRGEFRSINHTENEEENEMIWISTGWNPYYIWSCFNTLSLFTGDVEEITCYERTLSSPVVITGDDNIGVVFNEHSTFKQGISLPINVDAFVDETPIRQSTVMFGCATGIKQTN